MDKVDFDAYVDNYDELLTEGTSFFSKNDKYFARYKVQCVKKNVDFVPKSILEFGCGTGRNIQFLKEVYPEVAVEGSDISAKSIEFAKKHNPDYNFYVDSGDSDYDEKYDLIFIAGVFHHITPVERPGTIELLKKRLTKAGNIVVFEHNPYNPVTRRIVDKCEYDADAILVKPSEMKALFIAGGFQIKKQAFTLFFPPGLFGLNKLDPMLERVPFGGQYYTVISK